MRQLKLFEFLHNIDQDWEHGIKGIVLKFESKMVFTTNVVITECHIMAVAFLISLTHNLFIDLIPASFLYLGKWCVSSLLPSPL